MKILFTICGRAGSKGFQNKNLKEMNGVPLIYYTIAAVKVFSGRHPEHDIRTVLNTDSMELKKSAGRQKMLPGIEYVERKEALAGDYVPKADVIKDTYFAVRGGEGFDAVIDLDITSPMRRAADIENIITEYCSEPEYDLVCSAVQARRSPYFNMVEKKGGCYRKICASSFAARQEAPQSYELNASIYAYRPRFLESDIQGSILDYRCGISLMEDYLVLDIDSEKDFDRMEYMHLYYCKKDEGIREVYNVAKENSFV